MRLLVHSLEPALAGQGHERGPVQEGVGHPGHQIGGPGTQGAEAHAGPAGQAALDVGHEGAGLLVADRDELDRRSVERVRDVEGLLAGDPEDPSDPLGLEAPHQQVGGPLGAPVPGRVALRRHRPPIAVAPGRSTLTTDPKAPLRARS